MSEKKRRFVTSLAVPLLMATGVLAIITGRFSQGTALALSKDLIAVSNYVVPATVTVETGKSTGSGMIIDKLGNILTNQHVVGNAKEAKAILSDKREFTAKVVSTDKKRDVAIICIKDEARKDLPCVHFGNSDSLRVGELVMIIGNPFNLYPQTVTTGIISAMGRSDDGYYSLQTDASTHSGSSGSPLINMRGEVIGMHGEAAGIPKHGPKHGHSAGGISFAIPSNVIKSMLPALIKGEKLPE